MIQKLCEEILAGNNVRENLIELNKRIKEDSELDRFLDVYYEYETQFYALFQDEDAKVRKNVIKIFGRVADPVLLDMLLQGYKEETTQFLKSDYLNAIESFDYKEHLDFFKDQLKAVANRERNKHSIEEMKALQTLIWKIEPPQKHTFVYGDRVERLLLVVPKGHERIVEDAVREIPETTVRSMQGGCAIQTKHLEQVRDVRMYQALLFDFYPAMIPSMDGKVIGEKMVEQGILEFLNRHHKEYTSFIFRVDVKGITDMMKKNQLAKTLALSLEEKSHGLLINDSSYYEIEIRVIVGNKGCRVFLKMSTLPDSRFQYRKYIMATSMQPSKAALMMRYIKPYMKEDANVLDPFCGTGTLLIERALAGKVKSLYGLDISSSAIQAAWENSQRAGKVLNLVQRNFNDFRHEYTFDEILTDMPRESAHMKGKQLEYVYQLLFLRSRELLTENGILAVYCEDEYLMERCIKANPWIKRLKKVIMTKDQTSFVYILQKLYK
ncbi:MAG: methyltransferase domain-containing protein [Lachnospiraceae bacterium]|nr:methyltransferase domain-containing protein [Lachnospiraceae bacterium]